MSWSGPYLDASEADRQSRAAMAALCRRRGKPYPLPPGPSTGGIPIADPTVGYTTHATEVRVDLGGRFWVGLTLEIEALPASTERVDGGDVVVARSGVDKDDADFPDRRLASADAETVR